MKKDLGESLKVNVDYNQKVKLPKKSAKDKKTKFKKIMNKLNIEKIPGSN